MKTTYALFPFSCLLAGCASAQPGSQAPEAPTPGSSAPTAQPNPGPSSPAAASPGPSAASSAALAAPAPSSSAPPAPATAAGPCDSESVLVKGGTFTTHGAKQEATINDLCVDVRETTARQYAECVSAGACNADKVACAEQATYGNPERLDHPMVCVTFSQAEAYCAYRNKRLPRTEEWEWVARGGELARKFPWGDAPPSDQLCWSGVKGRALSCPVGSFPSGDNPQGIHDLAGNVLEFTTTSMDSKSPVRIARGGAWRDGVEELVRTGRVGGFQLSYRCGFLGIRCVAEARGQ
ncbi:MAG TPA: SUMF1/EgtB/PvdO family nonheme iron enzyme [Polyangiaceae bacterium]|nr:SUMF1/EgtB/PvdO family nonheme iron enzyme [Polyangiaceae bacterium]